MDPPRRPGVRGARRALAALRSLLPRLVRALRLAVPDLARPLLSPLVAARAGRRARLCDRVPRARGRGASRAALPGDAASTTAHRAADLAGRRAVDAEGADVAARGIAVRLD